MDFVQFIKWCIQENKMYLFYKLRVWKRLRKEVLRESHNECYDCRMNGIITLGTDKNPLEVHHINFIKEKPELALSKFYIDIDGNLKPNLVALCHKCHDKRHGRFGISKERFINEERW